MHGPAVRISHLTPRESSQVGWYTYSCIREAPYQDGIQNDQDDHDLEANLTFRFLGALVLLLQVRRAFLSWLLLS